MHWIEAGGRMSKSDCVLCALGKGEAVAATGVVERERLAFTLLNRFPYTSGHLMIVPMRHVANPTDLSPEEWEEIRRLMGRAVRALERTYHPHGYNIGINVGRAAGAGIEDHCHLHVVPRWDGDHNFVTVLGEARVIPEDLAVTHRRLSEALAQERDEE